MKEITKEEWEVLYKKLQLEHCWISQSQSGEDIIVETVLFDRNGSEVKEGRENFKVLNCKPLSLRN